MKKNLITVGTWADFCGQCIDAVEDALEAKGLSIPCEDRDIAISEGEDPEGLAILYGDLYGRFQDAISNVALPLMYSDCAAARNSIIAAVSDEIADFKADGLLEEDALSDEDIDAILKEVAKVCDAWKV